MSRNRRFKSKVDETAQDNENVIDAEVEEVIPLQEIPDDENEEYVWDSDDEDDEDFGYDSDDDDDLDTKNPKALRRRAEQLEKQQRRERELSGKVSGVDALMGAFTSAVSTGLLTAVAAMTALGLDRPFFRENPFYAPGLDMSYLSDAAMVCAIVASAAAVLYKLGNHRNRGSNILGAIVGIGGTLGAMYEIMPPVFG